MKNINTFEEFSNNTGFINESTNEWPKAVNSRGRDKTTMPAKITTKEKITGDAIKIYKKISSMGYKDWRVVSTGSSYLDGICGEDNQANILVDEFEAFVDPEWKGSHKFYNFTAQSLGCMKITSFEVAGHEFLTTMIVKKDRGWIGRTQPIVWTKEVEIVLDESKLAPTEPRPQWAIIRAQNPYSSGDRNVVWGWCRNDGINDEMLSPADFKKMCKRSADNLAAKSFYDHAGGSIYKIYSDPEQFKVEYQKLSGYTPKLD